MPLKKINLPYKLLIYDIETSLLKAHLFRLGEQSVRHTQLDPAHRETEIICITAKWFGDKKLHVFQGESAVKEFDILARKADVCLGKNSDRFDVKHINTVRMMQGLKPYPQWMDTSEDLEKQMRKYFALPSQSLDYISTIFGTGGKEKMEFSDWVDIKNFKTLEKLFASNSVHKSLSTYTRHHIAEVLFKNSPSDIIKRGKKALSKMIHYNKKDVLDTESALLRVLPYIKLKHNAASVHKGNGCTTCGSTKIIPTKIITKGQTRYQQFECCEHQGYAGKAVVRYDKNRHKVFGKMQ